MHSIVGYMRIITTGGKLFFHLHSKSDILTLFLSNLKKRFV